MKKRETFKDIEVNGRKFRIKKFDALTGSYVLYTVLTQLLPAGIIQQISGLTDAMQSTAEPISKEKFIDLQKDCLKMCSEIIPAGDVIAPMPIMLADGRWGIDGIENDILLVLALTVHVLRYNVEDFFADDALTGLVASITG